MTWTPEKIQKLRTLFADGNLSAAEIGALLGVSRNAVIGKLHRLGLTREPMAVRAAKRHGQRISAEKKLAESERQRAESERAIAERRERCGRGKARIVTLEAPAAPPITIFEPHHCRWPLDGALYCGRARGGRGPAYCNEHAAVAYTAAGCHNDGVKHNCHLDNLRWDYHSGNEFDKIEHGVSNHGERAPAAKLTWVDIPLIRELCARGHTRKAVAERYGVTPATIRQVAQRKTWTIFGGRPRV